MIISIYGKLSKNALMVNKTTKKIPITIKGIVIFLTKREAINMSNAPIKKINNIG